MILIGDLECDGLLENVSNIWCGVFKDIETKKEYFFIPETVYSIPKLLDKSDYIVMHNGIGYDRLVLTKILDYTIPLEKMIDTLVLSRLLNPDLKSPEQCKAKPHTVEAYGVRFGLPKQEHDDWSQYSDEMLGRCYQDVLIQEKIYYYLKKEMSK